MRDRNDDDFFDEKPEGPDEEHKLIALLDGFDKPDASEYKTGDKVSGTVLRIVNDTVFIDAGMRSEAVMPAAEVTGKTGNLTVSEGDAIEAFVAKIVDGNLELTKSISARNADISEIIEAMKNRIPVEGKVTGINKGGLQVKIMGKPAFCPVSHIELHYVEDVNVYLGKTMSFVIDRVAEGGRNIVLTRQPILEEGLVARMDELESLVGTGKAVTGTVTRIADFGLFVDCGGVEGLVHISEVSWSRAENLAESFATGQEVSCVVQKIERKEPARSSRISLSIKQAGGDPWDTVTDKYKPGMQVNGVVTRCTNFGAFVEIEPGVEGLVHVSEMSWGKRVNHASDVVSAKQAVTVTILAIDPVKRTISLTLKDVEDDPWKDAQTRYAPGTAVTGKVASQTKFGYFIDLSDGVTGLLPFANIAQEYKDKLKQGDTREVSVSGINVEKRRISLSLGMVEAQAEEAATREYLNEVTKTQKQEPAVSEFAASLMAALKNKK